MQVLCAAVRPGQGRAAGARAWGSGPTFVPHSGALRLPDSEAGYLAGGSAAAGVEEERLLSHPTVMQHPESDSGKRFAGELAQAILTFGHRSLVVSQGHLLGWGRQRRFPGSSDSVWLFPRAAQQQMGPGSLSLGPPQPQGQMSPRGHGQGLWGRGKAQPTRLGPKG